MSKRLEMQFKNVGNKTVTLAVDHPIEPVDPSTVSEVMDIILANNIFFSADGDLISKVGARVVERNVTDFEIV